jgi:ankyrin repeat protein
VDLNVKDTRNTFYVREGSDDETTDSDVDVEAVYLCGEGYAALHYACMFDQLETVRLLLDRGADVNAATDARVDYHPKDSRRDPKVGAFTPLMEAVSRGLVRVVELLLSRMTPEQVNAASAAGETALHIAGRASRLPAMAEIVRQLLDAGADVHARDALSRTPLMHVCSVMHERSTIPIVSLLLEHKADICTVDKHQATLLVAAARAAWDRQDKDPRGSIELISFLLRDPHATPEWVNARDFSAYGALNIAVVDGLVDCVRPLLEAKAALLPFYANHIQDLEKWRLPIYTNGTMEVLVDAGTDVSVIADINQSALYSAVVKSDTALVRLLLRANPPPDLNWRDINDKTLLFNALSRQSYPTLMMLLAAGADPTIPDKSGNIPLFEAREADTIAALLDAAPRSINHVDGKGRNALMQAYMDSQQAPRHFLGHLNALDTTATDKYGDTVLHIAMWAWRTEVVPKLLELPMDIFRGGRSGYTVMMKPFANSGYHRDAQDDRDISACLAMVADHVLRMPAVQGRTRKEPGDADGGRSSHKVTPKRRRR